MDFTFDPAKSAINVTKHSLSLADFEGFDTLPIVVADDRRDYGEPRFRAFGRIDGKPHMIAYAPAENGFRLISFRRAHEKEMRRYE